MVMHSTLNNLRHISFSTGAACCTSKESMLSSRKMHKGKNKFIVQSYHAGIQASARTHEMCEGDEQQVDTELNDGLLGRRQGLLGGMILMASTQLQLSSQKEAHAAVVDDAYLAALEAAFVKQCGKTKYAGLLRIPFHDAGTYEVSSGTGGANASIQFELDRPENGGLFRTYTPLEKVKAALAGTPAEGVSMADLIAYGGAYAVRKTGGPDIKVQLGRQDATSPDPEGRLPEETLNATELKNHFARMGFSVQELIAISGAHTLGNKGFGNPVGFDNAYYTTLLEKPWLKGKTKDDREMAMMIGLPSDKVLPEDEECLKWIRLYAADQDAFFRDFEKAYIKLTNLGATFV